MLNVAFYQYETKEQLNLEDYQQMIIEQFVGRFNTEVATNIGHGAVANTIKIDMKQPLINEQTKMVTYFCEIYYDINTR